MKVLVGVNQKELSLEANHIWICAERGGHLRTDTVPQSRPHGVEAAFPGESMKWPAGDHGKGTSAEESSSPGGVEGPVLRNVGLNPHRVQTSKVSNDPLFADKLKAIVGACLNQPEQASVLSVDEKSQTLAPKGPVFVRGVETQALDRAQPSPPLKKGHGQTMTHDYKRNGTTNLLAALNVANGEVFGMCQQKHRH